jgi:light-regulated signal transduction histidine kinase (bacteriophytochrome)
MTRTDTPAASGKAGPVYAAQADSSAAPAAGEGQSQDTSSLAARLDHLERELARVSAEFEQFASVVSHDLRSPLLSMTGCVELLKEQYAGRLGAEADELLGFITGSVQKLNEMMKGLLDYSRAGSRPLNLAECPLDSSLQSALRELKPAIQSAKAQITHDPLPVVKADAGRMTQLLQQLVDNAIKFRRPEPPQIHIAAEQRDGGWTLSVRDNGIGVGPEHTDRIFTIFQRLHGEECPGTGIGLALARKIVERHGGRIWVESEPQKGSTFRFTLPA